MSLAHCLTFTVNHLQHAALTNCSILAGHIQAKTPSQTAPILCLHGWLDNAASFIPLAKELAQIPELAHSALLAFEFAGHGHSAHRSPDSHYHFVDWVDDIASFCQQQGWQNLTIIGHSMGGMVASALAASFPELVSKLILIDSLGLISETADKAADQLRMGISSRQRYRKPRKINYRDLDQATEARQAQSDFDYHTALLLSQRGTIAQTSGISWRADMRLRHVSLYRYTPEQVQAIISAIKCPVLAIVASDSKFYQHMQHHTAAYKQLSLVSQQGGHHCHMTQPKQVAASIREFVNAEL
ncbi:alpha/beta fold hydrolase [Rheinheimera sp. WS51]|uniref:alpha/beta fold hydrolase n=1 Tax=Rheinheimera sp. WS51 TaxID=3425886 RepID=UPI003D8C1DD7